MAIPLSQFVRQDENIVKMPRVALVNSTDTMPPKTRTLDVYPPFPTPTNIGEIGDYPFVSEDPTPIGDEKFDSDNPPNFAVEYIVYVTDEGTGVNVSSEDGFETIDRWEEFNAATDNMGLTARDPQQGLFSLTFDKIAGNEFAGVQKTVGKDFSGYEGGSLFYDIYLSDVTDVLNVRLKLEDSSGNERAWKEETISVGWNTIELDFDNPNLLDDPGFDTSDISFYSFTVEFDVASNTLSGIELDDFKGIDNLTGKLSTGDVKVAYARNSAYQTRFTFSDTLNRWTLINEVLGEITNDSPRLQIPEDYTNDFNERSVDFEIEVFGTSLTVSSVEDETFFSTPAAGTVEFAIEEQTFNFNTDDLATFEGREVTYSEVADDEVTVDSSGVAALERNLEMTFQHNPTLSKKDLSLNYELIDEIVSNELTATKELRISFVPKTGSTSLRYDPLPDGAPDPLVEGTDFVIDEDTPAILFTKSSTGEVILSDFNVNPQTPGDPDSGQAKFDILLLNNTDIVANSVTLTDFVTGVLTEDEDYMIDLGSGQVLLTHGLVTETLMSNIFIADTAFTDIDFSFYINGDELASYQFVPIAGWVNIDRPLFPGDVVTVDYVSDSDDFEEPETITGEYVHTPGVELQSGRLITADEPAVGGEFSFAVQHPPVQVTEFTIEEAATEIVLPTDRTGDYTAGALLQLAADYYEVVSAAYDSGEDQTTVTVAKGMRQDYTNPEAYFTKNAPSWTEETTTHDPIPEGVSTFILVGGGDLQTSYYAGIFIRVDGDDIYAVVGSQKVNDDVDLEISLSTVLTQALNTTDTFERTVTPIPREEGTTFQTFYPPILEIPDRFDSNDELIGLDDRFPGIGSDSVLITRNGVELTRDFDYSITDGGVITLLREPLVPGDDEFILLYVPRRLTALGDEIEADYVYFSESESGVGIRITTEYDLPDTFYFRVVNNNTQALIYQGILEDFIKQKTGQVSAGSSPAIPSSGGNHESGLNTPITDVGDKYDLDLIGQRIYEFYDERISYLEVEKMELCGEVVGGFTGPITDEDVETNALGSGRTFPIDSDITFAVEDKDSDELIIPARPYRVPALFGMPVEDDISAVVRDKEYPRLPIVSIPPFPPQGFRYKGANQEPGFWSAVTAFNVLNSASAPTAFIEHWYPYFLDNTYTNPLTTDIYIDYGVSPADFDSDRQEVNQDTGDPNDAAPIFPPENRDLPRSDWSVLDLATPPFPTYESFAPRDKTKVPPGYEAAALGALQAIDDAIEAATLAGTVHRQLEADDTSYPLDDPPDGSGFKYRDYNEYDLLTNGTVSADTELALLQTQWAVSSGSRTTPTTYTDNIEQQILVLNIQVESLQRQIDALDGLLTQIDPQPGGDPEATTIAEADAAKTAAEDAQTDASAALDDAQDFYDDTIVGSDWSDTEIIARWFFLTGVDATGTPSGPSGDPLPTTPVTGAGRVPQVEARITAIVGRLGEINATLGFDNTQEPTVSAGVSTSENLYTTRYTWLDLRLNRESGTLFQALSTHNQYIKNINEAAALQSVVDLLSG